MKQKYELEHIDNSGQGNCMYYAYAISLMYFLHSKDNKDITDAVFIKLQLTAPQKEQLHILLHAAKARRFTAFEIEHIIEPMLGRATRRLGSERTREEFLEDPTASPVFASAKYGLEFAFKRLLAANGSSLALLINNDYRNAEFTSSEIYKVPGINNSIETFAKQQLFGVIDVFIDSLEQQWAAKLATPIDHLEHNVPFHRETILAKVIQEKTVAFFRENSDAQLNGYISHLNRNYQWSTEETLMTLNRAVTGERMVRNPHTGLIDTVRDIEIVLQIWRNEIPVPGSDTPDIILNNHSNIHWTSLIPQPLPSLQSPLTFQSTFFSPSSSLQFSENFSEDAIRMSRLEQLDSDDEFCLR